MTPTPIPEPEPSAELPLSVWATAQAPSRWQRQGRYLRASGAHPAKMLPAIARTAISAYTTPGELILDPMCGIGTTLVEAVHLGRRAVGIELESQWAGLAEANLALALAAGAAGSAEVICGDARDLVHLLPGELHGQVALVLTSPPYTHAAYNHGQVRTRPGQGVEKWHNRYSANPDNLGNTNPARLLAGVEQILAGCARVLRPGGLVVLTTRPWRWHGALVDLPGQVARAAERAGLHPLERNVALLAGLRRERLVGRASFFQIDNTRKSRAAGLPVHVVAHEDILVFRQSTSPASPLGSRHHG
jgi:SAM-dependent methyltransferase